MCKTKNNFVTSNFQFNYVFSKYKISKSNVCFAHNAKQLQQKYIKVKVEKNSNIRNFKRRIKQMTTIDISNLKLADFIDDNNNQAEKKANKSLLKFKKTILINQIKADLICIEYSDKLFISITTTGKPGTSLFVRSEQLANEQLYNVKTIFGTEEAILEVFARSLAEKLNKKHSVAKPLLVSVGTQKKQLENIVLFHSIEQAVLDFYTKE